MTGLSLCSTQELMDMEDSTKSFFSVEYCYCNFGNEIICDRNVIVLSHIYNCDRWPEPRYKLIIKHLNPYSDVIVENIEESVTELHAEHNTGLEYIPYPLLRFTNLVNMTFVDSDLIIAPLDSIKGLKSLKYLDLSHNIISKYEYDIHLESSSLNIFKMDYNILEAIKYNMFTGFPKLQFISLSHNKISDIESKSFDNLNDLTYLDLSHNNIEILDDAFNNLNNLQHLHLSYNKIKTFGSTFKLPHLDLNNLQTLNIDNNYIKLEKGYELSRLPELKSINLSCNFIESIDKAIFNKNSLLQSVDISYNKIKYIEPNCFESNNFSNFLIAGNQLEISLQSGIFNGLTNVKQLNLSHQRIGAIEDESFCGTKYLEVLNISYNSIELMTPLSLKCLQNLNTLDLTSNLISNISFTKNNLDNLKILILKNNKIRHIYNNTFQFLPELSILDLSQNFISFIPNKVFKYSPLLKHLSLQNNELDSNYILPDSFSGLSNLVILDLSSNLLQSLNETMFKELINMEYLNVSNCFINNLDIDVLKYTHKLEIIDLSSNLLSEFSINTNNISALTTLILDNNKIKKLDETMKPLVNLYKLQLCKNVLLSLNEDIFLANKALNYLSLSFDEDEVTLFNISSLPSNGNLHTLVLSGISGITASNNSKDINVQSLVINNSPIKSISQLQLQYFSKCNVVMLNRNYIEKIEKDDFKNQNVTEIDLSYNAISYIQPGSFKDSSHVTKLNISHNQIYDLDYGTFDGLVNLEVLDISYNSLTKILVAPYTKVNVHLVFLILDSNMISDVTDMLEPEYGTKLYISIGNNSIPCKLLINYNRTDIVFTALQLDKHTENVDGISCQSDETDSSNTNDRDAIAKLVPALNDLNNNLENLKLSLEEHIATDSEIKSLLINRLNESLDVSSDNVSVVHKCKHHNTAQLYEALKSENGNVLKLIDSVKEEWSKASKAIIFLSVVSGLLLLIVLAVMLVKCTNIYNIIYRFRNVRYTQHEDSVEMNT